MHLRIRKSLQAIFQRMGMRVIGLFRFFADYKIISFSILFILLDAVMITLLRRIEMSTTISLLVVALLSLILFFFTKAYKKRGGEIGRKKKGKDRVRRAMCLICELLLFLLLIIFFVWIRIYPILSRERQMEEILGGFTDGSTEIEGFLYEEPTQKHTNQQLNIKPLEDIKIGGIFIPKGQTFVLVKAPSFYKFKLGQVCKFRGTLEVPENFEGFDYRGYLRDKKIFLLMDNPVIKCTSIEENRKGNGVRNWLVDSKNAMIGTIDKVLNEPQSSLLAGIIFGQKRLFSTTFDEGTRVSGLSHIVAASGYNVTILVIASEKIFFFLPKKIRVIVGLIAIWMFAILSGLSSSIVRACIMGSISLVALLFGRSNAIHVAIPFASAIFLLINPLIVFDIGFLLSISAVLGLTYILPILLNLKEKLTKRFQFLDNNILPTLSCTLGTLPVSILTFQTFSIWSVPSNTIILPIIDTTMFLGILGILMWNIFKPFSYIFFTITNMQLKYFEYIVNLIYSLNWGQFEFSESLSQVVSLAFLAITILLTIYLYPIKNEQYNYYLKTDS